jgi:diguanylate cyclase (GGDEF)-like protein
MITLSAIRNARILIVDDQEANVKLLEFMLSGAGYTSVTSTMDSRTVLDLHKANRYDLILLDLNMPHMNGFQVLDELKQVEPEGYLPVLVVTAEPAHKLRALEVGAKDFISKPFDNVEVLTRIRNMLEVRLLYTQSRDYGLRLAHYDMLTGLPNRVLFLESLRRTLQEAKEHQGAVAVLLIDLDRFKNVNDTLGHVLGDELLRQFSHRLEQCATERNTIGRLGGDEFALFVSTTEDQQDVIAVANRIRATLHQPFSLKAHEVITTASIGIAVYPTDASDTEALIKFADTAMYRAKDAGRDTYHFFTAEMDARAQRRLDLENALRKAVDNNEFVLHYQPKVQISTGRIVGAEALIRWNRPGHGVVSPAEFIPLLEETGMIVRVGAWVIDTACKQIAEWARSGPGLIHLAVNVSGRQFSDGGLESVVMNAIRESGIEPDLLELELTESSLMENVERTIVTLQRLKEKGIQISIDDFGTGYSSLAYLKRFPIDKLKIDIAFIRDITTNPDDAAIALAVIGMAHSLELDVVAEGVETAAQLSYLSRHGCDQIQGYYFSRPLPAQEFAQMLTEGRTLTFPSGEAAVPPRTLLIVDDEQNVLNSLGRLLRQDGYNILTATSAAEGFEKLALNEVHVILCDQRMPEMNGTEFLDKVKNLYPDTFRIVLSGYTDIDAIMDAINRGALYRFFTKPWENKALRDNIRAAFRHYWQLHGMTPATVEAMLIPEETDSGQ